MQDKILGISPTVLSGQNYILIGNPMDLSPDIIKTTTKIESFAALPSGWYYGSGDAIEQNIIAKALGWLSCMAIYRFEHTNAFPGEGGEILIAGQFNDLYFEIISETDNSTSLSIEKNEAKLCYLDRINSKEAYQKFLDVVEDKWISSAFSIKHTSTHSKIASIAWPSKTYAGAYLVFPPNAWIKIVSGYVPTYGNSTPL